ncbi:MAG: GFA family protein [Pseudomonadota bacterium]
MARLTGRCMCGHVRWRCVDGFLRNLVCHCSDCQRATSAPFTAFVGMHPKKVEWSGPINHYASSTHATRGFCPACGTRLYFKSDDWPDEIHVHAATLDDPSLYKPDAQVVLRSKAQWLDELGAIEAYQDFHERPGARAGSETGR